MPLPARRAYDLGLLAEHEVVELVVGTLCIATGGKIVPALGSCRPQGLDLYCLDALPLLDQTQTLSQHLTRVLVST